MRNPFESKNPQMIYVHPEPFSSPGDWACAYWKISLYPPLDSYLDPHRMIWNAPFCWLFLTPAKHFSRTLGHVIADVEL